MFIMITKPISYVATDEQGGKKEEDLFIPFWVQCKYPQLDKRQTGGLSSRVCMSHSLEAPLGSNSRQPCAGCLLGKWLMWVRGM